MNDNWEKQEQSWWQEFYAHKEAARKSNYQGSPKRPKGIRHYYREMLFRHIRPLVRGKLWIDVGAGNSYTIVDLIHPSIYGYNYIATDLSSEGLKKGRLRTLQTPVVSGANNPPFLDDAAFIVSGFGILHHVPSWQIALNRMIDILQPGGYLLLMEAITKPRVFSLWRKQSYTAKLDSPHEGDIDRNELIKLCRDRCDIEVIDYSGTPLRFAIIWFLRLDKVLLKSYLATLALVLLDNLWKNTIGRINGSLGPGEVVMLARKR